jgi:hypothetical protein
MYHLSMRGTLTHRGGGLLPWPEGTDTLWSCYQYVSITWLCDTFARGLPT